MKKLLKWEIKSKYKIILGLAILFLAGGIFNLASSGRGSNLLPLGLTTLINSLLYFGLVFDFVNTLNKKAYGLVPVHRGKIYLSKIILGFSVYILIFMLIFLSSGLTNKIRGGHMELDLKVLGLTMVLGLSYGINLMNSLNLIVLILFIFKKVDQPSPNKYIVGVVVVIFKESLLKGKNFLLHQLAYDLRSVYSLRKHRFYSIRQMEIMLGEFPYGYLNNGRDIYINLFLILVSFSLSLFLTIFAYRQMEKSVEVGS